jgi:hypothetical protein
LTKTRWWFRRGRRLCWCSVISNAPIVLIEKEEKNDGKRSHNGLSGTYNDDGDSWASTKKTSDYERYERGENEAEESYYDSSKSSEGPTFH